MEVGGLVGWLESIIKLISAEAEALLGFAELGEKNENLQFGGLFSITSANKIFLIGPNYHGMNFLV